jgi:hypothetical protein
MTSGTAVGEMEAGVRTVRARSDVYTGLERDVVGIVRDCYIEDTGSRDVTIGPGTAFDNGNEFLCAAVTTDLEDYMEERSNRLLEPQERITIRDEKGWGTVKDIVDFTARTLGIEEYEL